MQGMGPVIFPYLDDISLGAILAPMGGLPAPHLILRGELSSDPSLISSVGSRFKENLLSMF